MKKSINVISPSKPLVKKKTRVAAYARVSSGKDAMLMSLSAQVSYYNDLIQKNPDWEFVGVFADEAMTGTKENRENFQKLLAACRNGEVDLVLTKSISRLARNTVTLLEVVRELKNYNVDVYFERENIHSMSGDGELMLTILASFAQEESLSSSENQKWRIKKNFEEGKPWSPQMLGYRLVDGKFEIVPDEAEIVRRIYREYLEGSGCLTIAKNLEEDGIPTRTGSRWHPNTLNKILHNYNYTGNLLLQKTFRENHITKKTRVNEGQLPQYLVEESHDAIIPLETFEAVQVPQYYVENSHPAIISADVFEMVQAEIKKRKASPSRHSGIGLFASRIFCGDCGAAFGAKVWHSTDKYRKVVYQCNHKFRGEKKCTTPTFNEEQIKAMFVTAVNRLIENKAEIIRNYEEMRDLIFDTTPLEKELEALNEELTVVSELTQKIVDENSRTAQNQEEYRKKYEAYVARFEKAKSRIAEVSRLKGDKEARRLQSDHFIKEVKKMDGVVTAFDERLWYTLVERIEVYSKEDIRFIFRNGAEIKI